VRIALVLALVAVGAVAMPSPASAAFRRDRTPLPKSIGEAGAGHASVISSGTGTGSAALHMVLGLAIVIALIFGIYWLVKRTSRRNDGTVRDDGFIGVVSSTPLGPQRSVHLVRVGDELVLVGASEQSVTPIRVYSKEEARKLGVDRHEDVAPDGRRPSFVEALRRMTAR
jgi:flagellar biosynthetic protein FliO